MGRLHETPCGLAGIGWPRRRAGKAGIRAWAHTVAVFAGVGNAQLCHPREPGDCQGAGSGPGRLIAAFGLTLLSTTVLAALVADHRSHGPIHGAELGLLVGVGLIASRQAVNAIFSLSSLRLFLIVAGHDVVLCILQGMILATWH